MKKHRRPAGSSPPAIDGSCYSPFDSSSSSSPSPSPSPSSSSSSSASSSSSSSDEEEDTAMATGVPAPSYPWGTLEDLLLASAVLKHGTGNWTDVSGELQSRHAADSSALFSAEACKCRFLALSGRFAHCGRSNCREDEVPWFEELRKLRVAQLRRELEHYEGTIGSLERKLKRLKADTSQNTVEVVSGKDSLGNYCHSQVFQDRQDPTLDSCCPAGTMADREAVLDVKNNGQSVAAGVIESLVDALNGEPKAQSGGPEQPAQSVIADCFSVQAGLGLTPGDLAIPAAQLARTCVSECFGSGGPNPQTSGSEGPIQLAKADCLSVPAAPGTSPGSLVKKRALDVGDSLQNISKVEAVKTGTDTPQESISLGDCMPDMQEKTMAAPRGAALTQPESTSLGFCSSNLKEEFPARCEEQATAAPLEGTKGILVDYSKNGVNGIDLLRLAYGSVQDGSTPVSSPEMVANEQQDPDSVLDMQVIGPYSEVKNSGTDLTFDPNLHRSYGITSTVAADCDTTDKKQITFKLMEETKDEVVSGHTIRNGIIKCRSQLFVERDAQISLDSVDREGMNTETHSHVAPHESSQKHVSTRIHLPSQQEKCLQSPSSLSSETKVTTPKAVVPQISCSGPEIVSAAIDLIPRNDSLSRQVKQVTAQECQKVELVSITEITIVKDGLDEAAAGQVAKDVVMQVASCGDHTSLHEANRACSGHANKTKYAGFGDKQTQKPDGLQSDLDAGADLIHNPPSLSSDALLPMAATTKDICIAAEQLMPLVMVKSAPAVDACEDDGLLLDIIKLKGSELSSLRKRRRSSKVDNLSGQGKNYLKENPAEMVACKQLKVENLSTEETGETPSIGNGKHSTREDHNLIGKEKETCRSSQNHKKLSNYAEYEEFTLELQDGKVSPSEKTEVGSPALSWTDDTPQIGVKMDNVQSDGAPDMLLIFDCLRKIDTHKFAPLFSKWSGLQENERYKRVIKRHMDLCKVRTQVEEGKYSGAIDFFRDMLLIFNNALVFFSKDSQEYGAAYILREFVIREMDKSLQREAASLSSKSTELRTLNNMLSASTDADAVNLEWKKDTAEPCSNDPDAAAHMAHANGEADGCREVEPGSGQLRNIDKGGELMNVHQVKDVDGGPSSKIISKTFMRGKNRVKIQANKVDTQSEALDLKKRDTRETTVPTTGMSVKVIQKNESPVPKQYAKKDASVSHDVKKSLLKSKEQVKDLDKRRSTRHLTGGRQAVTLPDVKKQSSAAVDARRAVAHQEGKKRSTGTLDGRQTVASQEEKKRSTAARSSRSSLSGQIVSKGKQMSCQPQKRGRT